MKIIFAGTPENAAVTLRELVASGVEVAGVITRADALVGRKQVLSSSPVANAAESLGLKVIKTNQIDDQVIEKIKSLKADVGVVVAYGGFLSEAALASISKGWFNLHYSLLPKLRGAAPVQHAILSGEQITGVSIFKLNTGMDSGDVFLQIPTKIEPGETSGRLLQRLTNLGVSGLLQALPEIISELKAGLVQDHSLKTFAPKISRAQAKIRWNTKAKDVERLVLAMNPEPMAWTTLQNKDIRISQVIDTLNESSIREPGTVWESAGKVFVACAETTAVELLEIQPAGKSFMNAADWYRGANQKGDVFFD